MLTGAVGLLVGTLRLAHGLVGSSLYWALEGGGREHSVSITQLTLSELTNQTPLTQGDFYCGQTLLLPNSPIPPLTGMKTNGLSSQTSPPFKFKLYHHWGGGCCRE